MSTQLLDPGTEEVVETGAPHADALTFDAATRCRIEVAGAVADTLEELSSSRAWERLDPAIGEHLLAQAGRLGDHVAQLGTQRAVRSVEDVMLRLKRLERRLQISVDELCPKEQAARAKSQLFLGDFTELEPELDGAPQGGKGKAGKTGRKPEKRGKKKSAGASLREGVHQFKTKAQKAAARASSRRIQMYMLGAFVACVAAAAWNLTESLHDTHHLEKPPERAFTQNGYLKEMNIFLPATFTVLRDRDIRIVVSKDWLLRSEARRHQDADGAYTWLSNRNVVHMMLTWEDGTPLAKYDENGLKWFDMTHPGKVSSVQRAE